MTEVHYIENQIAIIKCRITKSLCQYEEQKQQITAIDAMKTNRYLNQYKKVEVYETFLSFVRAK